MAAGDGSFRSRAASLLPNAQHSIRRSLHRNSNAEKPILSQKTQHPDGAGDEDTTLSGLEKSQSHISSGGTHHTSGSDAVAHNRDAQRIVRTIPSMYTLRLPEKIRYGHGHKRSREKMLTKVFHCSMGTDAR